MFDFLIDIVPRDEIQVKPTKKQVRQSTAGHTSSVYTSTPARHAYALAIVLVFRLLVFLSPPLPPFFLSLCLLISIPYIQMSFLPALNLISFMLCSYPPSSTPFTSLYSAQPSLLSLPAGRDPPCSHTRTGSALVTALSKPAPGTGCSCQQCPQRGLSTAVLPVPSPADKPKQGLAGDPAPIAAVATAPTTAQCHCSTDSQHRANSKSHGCLAHVVVV